MPTLVLASTSRIRATLLHNAGLEFEAVRPDVDEAAIKQAHSTETPDVLAAILATHKAIAVSRNMDQAIVIGADQILAFGGKTYDKPATLAAAREQLLSLRGQTHSLVSGISCAARGEILWQHVSQAHLTMRNFSESFLGAYLNRGGKDLLTSVGGYKLEGEGVQLFEKIEGDYFTILGLPLLPLLAFLRNQGLLAQ